jgi:tau tubulin kinase
MSLDPGKRFKVQSQLGEGSFSKIYQAFDKKLKINVALKVEKEDKHKKVLRFEYEILKNLQGLSHVPKLFDFIEHYPSGTEIIKEAITVQNGKISGLNFIVMELLGKNVGNYKKSKSGFSNILAYDILIQMLDAIEDLHEMGYIHRDIKPANFVIKEVESVSIKL